MRNLRQFWTPRRIGEDQVSLARLGPLRLWLARAEKEWGFAIEYGETVDVLDLTLVPEDVVPGGLNWNKTLFSGAPREFLLQPSVPDRALVVKPGYPVLIPAHETGTFYLSIPVFVTIAISNKDKEHVIGTIPSRKLSDSWFGGPTAGEYCYSLPFSSERDLEALDPKPNEIICPVEILNESEDDLIFEKFCFRPKFLGIYSGDRNLWTKIVSIRYEGFFRGSEIRYNNSLPKDEANLLEITKPQIHAEKRFRPLTFSSGFGRDIIFGK